MRDPPAETFARAGLGVLRGQCGGATDHPFPRSVSRSGARLPAPAVEVFTDGSVLHPHECRKGGGGFFLTDAEGATHRRHGPLPPPADDSRYPSFALPIEQIGADGLEKFRRGEDWLRSRHNELAMTD